MRFRQQGFTLIEMLVAMAIFSSLIVVLMTGYSQGLMMWGKGQQISRQWLDMEFRYRLLDTLFAQVVVADDAFSKGLTAPYFVGDSSTIKALTAAPVMDDLGRVRPVFLQLFSKDDGLLVLRYQEGPLYSDQRRGIRWSDEWVVLLDGLKSASFSFEAPENPLPDALYGLKLTEQERHRYRDQPEWISSFQGFDFLLYPRRIALQFTDANDESHQWLFRPPDISDAWTMAE